MKILILQDDFPPHAKGGAARVAYNLAHAYQECGHEVLVITTVQNYDEVGTQTVDGFLVEQVYSQYHARWRAWRCLYNPQTISKLHSTIKDFKPDVVHAHNVHLYLSYATLKIAKKSGAKVFLTAHDTQLFMYGKLMNFTPKSCEGLKIGFNYRVSWIDEIKRMRWRYNPIRNYVIRYYLKYVDQIVSVSKALQDVLEQNGIKKVCVIHNGINSEEWILGTKKIQEFKEHHKLVGRKVVMVGGRMNTAKGIEQSLLSLQKVVSKFPEAVLLVLGKEIEPNDRFIVKAKELGIDNCVMSSGWVSGDTLKAAFLSSDVILVPSLYPDPFPTVVLEAMACKKPVVGTCFGGTPEIVKDGETGYLVSPFEVELFAEKICTLLRDESLAKKMGDKSYKRVCRDFTLSDQAKQYLQLFEII